MQVEAQVEAPEEETPELVEVEANPGVQVVYNVDVPVFYSDNFYWRYDNGGWYRSSVYNGGWISYNSPPERIRRIDRPTVYSHYRPSHYVPRASRPGYVPPRRTTTYREPTRTTTTRTGGTYRTEPTRTTPTRTGGGYQRTEPTRTTPTRTEPTRTGGGYQRTEPTRTTPTRTQPGPGGYAPGRTTTTQSPTGGYNGGTRTTTTQAPGGGYGTPARTGSRPTTPTTTKAPAATHDDKDKKKNGRH